MEYDLPNFVSGDQLLQTRTFVKSIREQYLEPVQAKFRALEKLWIDVRITRSVHVARGGRLMITRCYSIVLLRC